MDVTWHRRANEFKERASFRLGVKMAEVDFGDSELFEQLEDSAPLIPRHIRFTNDDEENQEESNRLQIKLEECEANIQKLSEENILVSVAIVVSNCSVFASTATIPFLNQNTE